MDCKSLHCYLVTNNSHWSVVVHVIRLLSPHHLTIPPIIHCATKSIMHCQSSWEGMTFVWMVFSFEPLHRYHVYLLFMSLTGILHFFNIGTLLSVCTCIIGIHGVGNYCPFFLCPHISWAHDIQDPMWALVIIISLYNWQSYIKLTIASLYNYTS